MKNIKFIILLLGLPILGNSQNVANRIFDYIPAPGQHINIEQIGTPQAAQKMPENENNLVSLGGFGGTIILGFEKACVNDSENPYGVDFTIFGNAFSGLSEPGVVWVMNDENQNGQPDDRWFEIAGSNHFHSKTIKNYAITYFKTETRDNNWKDNFGNSGSLVANDYNLQEYYPTVSFFPEYPQDSVNFNGTFLEAVIDNSNPHEIKIHSLAFGYADNHSKKQGVELTTPDNPYSEEIEGAGGDPIDISWAVDSLGNYMDLDSIHFVKIVTGNFASLGRLGEVSTDISYVVDVEPNINDVENESLLVVYHHPNKIMEGDSIQLEAQYFVQGRKIKEVINYSSTNLLVAAVDQNGKLVAKNIGETEIEVSVLDEIKIILIKVVAPDSIQILADFTSVYPGESILLIADVFDNEGETLEVQTHFSTFNIEVGEIVGVGERTWFVAHNPGETTIKCKVEGFNLEKMVSLKVLSENDKIQVYFTLKTENKNLFPLQWIEVGLTDLNGFVENRQSNYSELNRHFLGHALLAGLQKTDVNFNFRDDENSDGKLYLYSVEKEGLFTYGWGGKTNPQAFARAWIARLNNKQYLNNFDEIEIANGDSITLYHVSDISQPWQFSRMIPSTDSAVAGENIELLLEQTTCTFINDSILENGFSPMENIEVVAGQSFYADESGKVNISLESDPPLVITSGNDAVLISKRITTDVEYFITPEIQVYPNPVENELNISGENLIGARVFIFNANGKQIAVKNINSESFILDTRNLIPGLYQLKVVHNKQVEFHKFIKK